jgi:hypothetical protein
MSSGAFGKVVAGRVIARAGAIVGVLGLGAGALGQANSVTADCSGASVPAFSSASDIVRMSPAGTPIRAAAGYQFAFNPIVTGTGLFASTIGTNRPLGEVLNGFVAGGQRTLFGAVRNRAGTVPLRLDTEVVGGTFSGITVSLTLIHEILASGQAQGAIRNIQKPFGLGLNVNSGGLIVSTWTPPAPVVTEWHFDGDLQSVRENGLAPTSGPAKLRYLDSAQFGPIPGGFGALDQYPTTPTPTGVTQAQSAFGTTTAFGIPPVPGAGGPDTVYRTSPPRSAANPTDSASSRGIGLSLWPNTRDFWPEERNGQWTMVWDLLIPQASWDAAKARTDGVNQCIPLVETSSNNNSEADLILKVTGAGAGAASVGDRTYVGAATIQPNQWFRLAMVIDHYARGEGRVFVNGQFLGTTGSDWLYNACKSTDPHWGDASAASPSGTAVAPGTWASWGQFPSPWAQLNPGASVPVYMYSTASLFADLAGRGESVYVANMLFTDEAMSDAQVAALGGPNARGIVYLRPLPCRADYNGTNGVDLLDIFAFLTDWFAGNPRADFDGMNGVDLLDIFAFLQAWFAGC